jgi:hypothetical protein
MWIWKGTMLFSWRCGCQKYWEGQYRRLGCEKRQGKISTKADPGRMK